VYDPTQDDDKEAEQSQYSALLAPAAPAEAAATPSAAPSAAPKKSSTPGFVNFDRYVNANKDNVARDREAKQKSVDSRYSALTDSLGSAQNVQADTGRAPTAGESIAPASVRDIQAQGIGSIKQGLSGEAQVTKDEAIARAGATYGGPTQQDVDSKYAPLLAQKNRLQEEANAAKTGSYGGNAFDDALIGATGGVDYSKVDGMEKQYDSSYTTAQNAAQNARTTFDANKSAWQVLLDQYGPVEAAAKEAETERIRTSQARADRQAKIDTYFKSADANQEVRQAFTTMTPEEQDAFMALDTRDPYFSQKANQIVAQAKDRHEWTTKLNQMKQAPGFKQAFAKMTPEEVAWVENGVRNDPYGMHKFNDLISSALRRP
jgi:hypothetical protein